MDVTFICKSLEFGKDGVGDYTRLLAQEMYKSNSNIHYSTTSQFMIDEKQNKSSVLNSEGIVSWQIVPYSYNPKGIIWPAVKELVNSLTNKKTHLMFHELWIGSSSHDPLKHKIVGFFQKRAIKKMIRKIAPVLITTSNNYYKNLLKEIGVDAIVLPISSNIPKVETKKNELYNTLTTEIRNNRNDYTIAAFFGSIHNFPELEQNINELNNKITATGKKFVVTHIGKCNQASFVLEAISKKYGIETYIMGMASPEEISDYLSSMDLGLSTYPKVLFEKSGSISALLLNGLPVVLLRKSFKSDTREIQYLKELNELNDVASFINQSKSFSADFTVSNTALKLDELFRSL